MPTVDDELTRRLQGAERPVDGDGVFEGLGVRRSHRERLRRIQAGLIAVAVLAATAGGFAVLREAFEPDDRGPAVSPSPVVLPSNGEIVFARDIFPDSSRHLFAVRLGVVGERRITSGADLVYEDPSISPDGTTIVATYFEPSFLANTPQDAIVTVPIEGGGATQLTDPIRSVSDPEWSPDGTMIAFAGMPSGAERPGIYVMSADGSGVRRVAEIEGHEVRQPDWSVDGRTLVFVGFGGGNNDEPSDLYTVRLDGSGLTNLTQTPELGEWSPSWAPDGSLIAYAVGPQRGPVSTIRLIDPSGEPAGDVAVPEDADIGDVVWSPDGQLIAFTSSLALTDSDDEGDFDVWTLRRDGTDLANHTTDGAYGLAWQPVPAGSSPTSPEPTIAPIPEGEDVGLGFNLCHSDRLGGIDFLGRGDDGFAWVGVPTKDDGTCPASAGAGAYVAAADIEGDGRADMWSDLPWRCDVLCTPHAATDLDGNGAEELVVASHFSIMGYHVMRVEEYPSGGMDIRAVVVAEPGHPSADLQAGEPLRIDAGGDAGYGSGITCEGFPDSPVIVWSWAWSPVESEQPKEVHITRLQLQADGLFHVIGTNDYTVPWDELTGISDQTAPACGVDWHPNA
jgi:WD40-like Beta Propeller Repeat